MSERIRCPKCRRLVRASFTTDGNGRMVEVIEPCEFCERKRAGICQRCKRRPVKARKGSGLFCAPCYQPAINERVKRRKAAKDPLRHAGICADCKAAPVDGKVGWALTCGPCRAERKRASSRRTYQNDEAKRIARNEYKREWRRKNRAKVRMQKRRAALRGKTAETQRRIRERIARGEHVRTRTRWNEHGERLCLRDGCPAVLTGHCKLCPTCRGDVQPVERAA